MPGITEQGTAGRGLTAVEVDDLRMEIESLTIQRDVENKARWAEHRGRRAAEEWAAALDAALRDVVEALRWEEELRAHVLVSPVPLDRAKNTLAKRAVP